MVVPMKKLHVLLPAADREPFLKDLAGVGVVHIEEGEGERRSQTLEQTAATIKRYRGVADALTALAAAADAETPSVTPGALSAEDVVTSYEKLDLQRDAAAQKVIALQKDIATLAPWGNFEPDLISKLQQASVTVRFFETPAKKFDQLNLAYVPHEVIAAGSSVKFVVVDRGEPSAIEAEEISLPPRSLKACSNEIDTLEKEMTETNRDMKALVSYRTMLEKAITELSREEAFESARLNMESAAEGAVLLLTGWFPAVRDKKVADLLATRTAWFEIREPNDEEQPPVKLRNSMFTKLFEPITKMFSLPDYFELDPTPFFTPFFMFFYGMCLGDVGYGLMLLALGLVFLVKGPKNFRGIFILVNFLAGMTIVNGFLLNSFFGASIFNLEGVHGLAGNGGVIPFLGPKVVGGKMEFPAITFAVYLGFVQMLLGMGMQVYNKFKNKGLIYAVQPLCYVPLSLVAFIFLCKANFLNMGIYEINGLQLGVAIASVSNGVMKTLLLVGLVPFVFLNSPQIKIFWRPLMALYAMYNFASDIVSSGLSYLRLFALGLAGGLLGNAFNEIALMLLKNDQGEVVLASPLIVFTILIMIAGHSLNFFLSALGAYVHSVRLIFVEFYKFLDFTGGGRAYSPFTENVTENN